MRIGSLFSGAAGLDRAVEAVFGAEVAWFAEIDKAASKVLAHHYPHVPNLGDITAVDWCDVPAVDVLCGGFPCQDVSAAGKRAGIKDGTRSGLWSVFAEAIDALRPQWVVIENVRGLLSATAHRTVEDDDESGGVESSTAALGNGAGRPVLRAAGAVLGDLADLGYDAQWATVAAADVGAPHRRERVFIVAADAEAGQHADDQLAWGNGAQFAVAGREPGVALLPTPNADVGRGVRSPDGIAKRIAKGDKQFLLEDAVALLPTPSACNPNDGEGTETWLARREAVKARVKNGNGMGMPLSIAVQLLPTPNAQDGNGGGRYSSAGHQSTLPGEVRLLPTPRVGGGGDCESERRRNSPGLESEVAMNYLPTPTASDCTGGGQNPDRRVGHTMQLIDEVLTTAWGKYEPAIRRWESIVGPAPAPTEPNKNGNPRLSAAFSEWLMGWPAGWVTDPAIGISRNDQLRIVWGTVCARSRR